jgi:hypothetical protein
MEFLQLLQDRAYGELDAREHLVDLQGWVNAGFDTVLEHICESLRGKEVTFFEVGTWKGPSAARIVTQSLKAGLTLRKLVCIDTWLGSGEFLTWGLNDPHRGGSLMHVGGYPTVFHTFTMNMKVLGLHDVVVPLPISSVQAVEVLTYYGLKADVIYVDASHEYEAVKADLEAYHQLLLPGGFLWGDDYTQGWDGVRRAVDSFAESTGMSLTVCGENWLLH